MRASLLVSGWERIVAGRHGVGVAGLAVSSVGDDFATTGVVHDLAGSCLGFGLGAGDGRGSFGVRGHDLPLAVVPSGDVAFVTSHGGLLP